MVTNVTINPVESAAVVYLQDGTTTTVNPGETQSLQLVERGFCTISDVADPDTSEHPPQVPPERLTEAWKKFWEAIGGAIDERPRPDNELPPTATPV